MEKPAYQSTGRYILFAPVTLAFRFVSDHPTTTSWEEKNLYSPNGCKWFLAVASVKMVAETVLYEILLEIALFASTLVISGLQTCLQNLKSYLSFISKTVKSTEAVGPFLWWKTLLHIQ